ncbi:MAG: hypothetical protein H6704_23110 [Myxococcales bacterium]|nr:hypothetical protein [Myxococcales bacterium]MCB9539122.1 hypothetical protein [Myxococcales bacterium]
MTTAPAPRPPANLAGLRAHPCDPLLLAVRVGARPLAGLAAWVDWRLGGPISRLVRAGRVPTEGPLLLPPWRLLPAGRVLIWRVGAATAADLARAVRELGAGAPGLCPEDFGLTAAEVARAFDGGATLFAPEVP